MPVLSGSFRDPVDDLQKKHWRHPCRKPLSTVKVVIRNLNKGEEFLWNSTVAGGFSNCFMVNAVKMPSRN